LHKIDFVRLSYLLSSVMIVIILKCMDSKKACIQA